MHTCKTWGEYENLAFLSYSTGLEQDFLSLAGSLLMLPEGEVNKEVLEKARSVDSLVHLLTQI